LAVQHQLQPPKSSQPNKLLMQGPCQQNPSSKKAQLPVFKGLNDPPRKPTYPSDFKWQSNKKSNRQAGWRVPTRKNRILETSRSHVYDRARIAGYIGRKTRIWQGTSCIPVRGRQRSLGECGWDCTVADNFASAAWMLQNRDR
jgi:hypothetical protein